MQLPDIEMKFLSPHYNIFPPFQATSGSAGLDLKFTPDSPDAVRIIAAREHVSLDGFVQYDSFKGLFVEHAMTCGFEVRVPLGVAIHIGNRDYAGLLSLRSSAGEKYKISMTNGVGLIDADYQGELILSIRFHTDKVIHIPNFARLAQLVITPIARPIFRIVDNFSRSSDRGAQGFGSSGS